MRVPRVLVVLCFFLGAPAVLAQTEPVRPLPSPEQRTVATAPAGTPLPAAGSTQRVVLPVAISLFSRDVSTNMFVAPERPVTNLLAVGLVNGGTALYGLGLALAGNAYDEETRGVMLAGWSNTVSSDAAGLQVSGLVNTSEGRFAGVQVTAGANTAQRGLWGLQVAGLGNGTENLRGLQATLLGMNFAAGNVRGVQLSGLGSNDADDVFGLQFAGIVNSSRTLSGVQVGLVNVSGDVAGAQVGLINIGSTVRGTQLGLLNFATRMKGVPLGLASFEEGAPFHLETWASDIQLLNVGVKFGGKSTYTTLLAGMGPDARLQRYSLGLGFGGHLSLGRYFWMEMDMAGSVVRQKGEPLLNGANALAQGRLMLGLQLFEHLALFAGPTYNAYFSWSDEDRQAPTTLPVRQLQVNSDITLQHWPGMQFGLRI